MLYDGEINFPEVEDDNRREMVGGSDNQEGRRRGEKREVVG